MYIVVYILYILTYMAYYMHYDYICKHIYVAYTYTLRSNCWWQKESCIQAFLLKHNCYFFRFATHTI